MEICIREQEVGENHNASKISFALDAVVQHVGDAEVAFNARLRECDYFRRDVEADDEEVGFG